MAFEKGNNLGSVRPNGSANKISKDIREFSALLLQGELENLKAKLPTLNDGDYLKVIAMLFKNALPAQKYIETHESMPTEISVEIIDRLSHFTHKEIDAAIDDYARNK